MRSFLSQCHALGLAGFLLCLSLFASAQNPCVTVVGSAHIVTVADDGQSIWAGTQQAGLIQIDKNTLQETVFDTSNTVLNEDRILSVLMYHDTLYISTESQLFRRVGGTITLLSDTLFGVLAEAPWGELIVAGHRRVYYLNSQMQVTQQHNMMNHIGDAGWAHTTDVAFDDQQHLWISHFDFYEYDVLEYDGNVWTVHDWTTISTFPVEAPQQNGIAWINDRIMTTSGNLQGYYNSAWAESSYQILSNTIVNGTDTLPFGYTAIEADQNDVYWVGTGSGMWGNEPGKLAYNDGTWHVIPDWDTIPFFVNTIYASTIDEDWVYAGTTHGLVLVDLACLQLTQSTPEATPAVSNLLAFPNPAADQLSIKGLSPGSHPYQIYNLAGQSVQSGLLSDARTITISDLPAGVYHLALAAQPGSHLSFVVMR